MGEHFGNYEIIRRLAAGGMAEVLLAKQKSLGGFERLVCLKRILPHLSAQEDFLKMFQDEARIAANLVHPNIAQIYDIGEHDGHYYIAMEYVRGEDVRRIYNQEVARGQTLPRHIAALITMGAAAGLDYAHRQTDLDGAPLNLVHRDISPQNIVVSYDGHAKIVDFGVAKAAGKLNQTRAGVLKGKYSYMSPEQASGDPVDGRTDIFALGVTLYETTTGARLFKRDNELETLHAVLACNVPPPTQLVPRYDRDFEALVLKALAFDPEQRYQTAGELEQDLERYLLGHGFATSASHLAAYMQDLFAEKLADEALFGGTPWHEPNTRSPLPEPARTTAEPVPGHLQDAQRDWQTQLDPLEHTHAKQTENPPAQDDDAISLIHTVETPVRDHSAPPTPQVATQSASATSTPVLRQLLAGCFLAVCLILGIGYQHHRQHRTALKDVHTLKDAQTVSDTPQLPQSTTDTFDQIDADPNVPAEQGRLSVITPVPMQVMLGNQNLGITPLTNVPIAPGALRLKFINTIDGGVASRHIRIRPGQHHRIRYPSAPSQLQIQAQPWAWVQYGTHPARETPCQVTLYEGDYSFVLECPNGHQKLETVHIVAGQDAQINLVCTP